MSNILVVVRWLVLFEGKRLVDFVHIWKTLQLLLIHRDLLLQVLDSLRHIFGDFQVVLDLLHGSASLGLLQSIFGQSLMSVFKLANLILLQIDLSHFPVVVRQLFVIIVVSRLLLLLKVVDRLLVLV